MVSKNSVQITNPDKILFPESKITKLNLINYYNDAADLILPHTKNRPIAMVRCPNGITKECFFQKNAPAFYPEWINLIPVERADKKVINYVNCKDKETLIFIANQGCITPHTWLSALPELNNPNKIVFDLDPSENSSFDEIRESALQLKKLLYTKGLKAFAMTTGSRGIHVVIPIKPIYDFDVVKKFAKSVALELVEENANLLTIDVRKDKRNNKIFVDYLRNSWGATSVAPYCVRPKEGAPVAAPIFWKEVEDKKLKPDSYTIANILKRHADDNPWADYFEVKNKL